MTIPTTLPVELGDYNFCVTLNLIDGTVRRYRNVGSIPRIVGDYVIFDQGDYAMVSIGFDQGDCDMVSIGADKVYSIDIHAVIMVRDYIDMDPWLSPVLPGSAYVASPSVYRRRGRHHV